MRAKKRHLQSNVPLSRDQSQTLSPKTHVDPIENMLRAPPETRSEDLETCCKQTRYGYLLNTLGHPPDPQNTQRVSPNTLRVPKCTLRMPLKHAAGTSKNAKAGP